MRRPTTSDSSFENQDSFRVVWGPQRFYLSIGWKTLIAFALVVFIPMLGLMMITGQTLRSTMEGETFHSLEANLRGAWRVYYERMNSVQASLIQSSNTPMVITAVQQRDTRQLAAHLSRQAAQLPYADVWLVLDKEKRIVARRNGEVGSTINLNSLVAHAYASMEPVAATELLSNELFMQENPLKYSSLDPQVMVQAVVVPVKSEGQLIGALAALILMNNNDWLPNAIHDYLSIDAALFGSLIQESRVISASPRPNNIWAPGLLAPTSINDDVQKGHIYRGKVKINDILCFVISEPIVNLEGRPIGALSIGVKSDNIDAIILRNARNIYLFIGVGIALSLVIAYLAYRDTMTPMRAIMGAMEAFAGGNLRVRTEIRTKDEFEGLGLGFNRMASSIQEHQERVESFNSLSNLLIASLRPRELMQSVLDKVIELTRSQAGVIYLSEEEGNLEKLAPYVSYAVDIEAMGDLSFGQGLAGEAARKRSTIHVTEIPDDCRLNVNFGIADILPREAAFLPIIYRDRVMGIMALATLNRFKGNELSVLEYMTNQIAIVLENALSHEQVERLSITDVLTGAYNRRYLNERLEEEFSKSARYHSNLSVLLIDVDHFKRVNDVFGHQVGDEALIAVANALRTNLRETDMLGRYGGEEFMVLLPHSGPREALAVAEKLRNAVQQVTIPGMGGKQVTISIGAASYPDGNGGTAEDIVRHADHALYEAKESGRNRVVAHTPATTGSQYA